MHPSVRQVVMGRRHPRNTDVAMIGDSITAASLGSAGGGYTQEGGASSFFAKGFSRQRFTIPVSNIKGTSGNTTTQMLARITDVTALSAGTVIIQGGVNDVTGGAALQTIIDNIESMIRACRSSGQIVVLQGPHPVDATTTWTAGQLAIWAGLRDWVATRHRPAGGVWANQSAWNDIASSPGGDVATSGMLYDAIHPAARGHRYIGYRLSQMLDTIFSASEPWDTVSPNYVTNSGLTGTGGTKNNGVTGSVADNWIGAAGAALSGDQVILASKETIDGRVWQQFHITGTWGSTGSLQLYQVASGWGTTWNIGNVARAAFDVELDTPASGTLRGAPAVGFYYKAGTSVRDGFGTNNGPEAALALTMRTNQFTLPADATRIYPLGELNWLAGTIDMTVRFSRPVLEKVS